MVDIGRVVRLAGVALALVVFAGCQAAPGATPTPPAGASPSAAQETLVIGFTVSQTGATNVESTRQQHGLQLWMDQVNAAGGIHLANGTSVMLSAKSYDDESNKDRIQELYTKLINEDGADFLISPYSSGLADAAAVIAEQNSKLMITTGAASDGTYKKGFTHVFQTYTPASRYLTGAVDLLKSVDATATTIAIIHENDKFSSDVAAAAYDYALAQGYQVPVNEGYESGATDFASLINKIGDADAVMGGGHFADTSTFAKQMYEKNVGAALIALLVAPPEPSFTDIGAGAQGIVGPSQWEPTVTFSQQAAQSANLTWIGPTPADFTTAYRAAFNEEPSYHSAGGYAAGLILQAAIEAAGTTATDAVKTAMDGLDLMTFFGRTKFDTTAEAHGLQIAHDMVYIQWQGTPTDLHKEVVWPVAAKTADAVYPLR